MTPDAKPRFPAQLAVRVAAELAAALAPAVDRLVYAGSLRRECPTVGDLEILYIPRLELRSDPDDLFHGERLVNVADEAIARLESTRILERRLNVNGSQMFGDKNKLMRHIATGLPVDLFSANPDNWANYLVCRTGPAESNTLIAARALARGWHWHPYGAGFSCGRELVPMRTEKEVFDFVGLPYHEPALRN